jgi:hypothetical protein
MTFTRIVLLGSALVYGAIGVAFVVAPHALAPLVGIDLTSVTADNDFRAVYGGVPAGLAVFIAMGLRRPQWELPALWVVALTLGGLAATRVLSWGVAGWPEPIGLALHASEAFGLVLAIVAIRRSVRETPA